MDYTDDLCMDMITAGKKNRWLGFSVSESWRSNLISTANIAATGCNTPMALSVVLLRGTTVADGNKLSWIVPHALVFVDQVVLERSTSGLHFSPVSGNLRSDAGYDYAWIDLEIVAAPMLYYRVRVMDIRGELVNSSVIELANDKHGSDITVYPNPASEDVSVSGLEFAGIQEVLITDLAGHVLVSMPVAEGVATMTLSLRQLPPGIYAIRTSSADGTVAIIRSCIPKYLISENRHPALQGGDFR